MYRESSFDWQTGLYPVGKPIKRYFREHLYWSRENSTPAWSCGNDLINHWDMASAISLFYLGVWYE